MSCNQFLAPNGEPSLLYAALLQKYGEDRALQLWTWSKSSAFKSTGKDVNGEPFVSDVIASLESPEVQFQLKSTELLMSPKGDEIFRKGDKHGWSVEKMLNELQIPAAQKELILSFNTRNREEIITNLLANYSYTVEINTSTKNEIGTKESYNPETGEVDIDIIEPDFDYIEEYDDDGNIIGMKPVLTEKGKKQLEEKPTQHYSNLTVPGGTNYTENEIATPAITPSIKGHAQFATENGIGWFRSDEQVLGGNITVETKDFASYIAGNDNEAYPVTKDGTPTKTRRILEVQSDLFQKGRLKEDLILSQNEDNVYNAKKEDSTREEFWIAKEKGKQVSLYNNTFYEYNGYYYDFLSFSDKYYKIEKNSKIDTSENQFLQLLNKDNNWVTFFVKSIIQDSAKKGYEKVLFPSGNTASKVEGHTTLEEFKKQKEDRIKELENKVQNIKERGYLGGLNSVEQSDQFGDYTQYLDQNNKGEFEEISKEEYDKRCNY